jgi:hypothetical protein
VRAPLDTAATPPADLQVTAAIEHWRDQRWRRTPERQVHIEAEARAFFDEVGLAFLYGERGTEIPTLWGAVSGSRGPVPQNHNDPYVGRVWEWKDTLPARKEVYYGKWLRGKPTFVSLALLPAAYALSPNYGDPLDYIEQYEAGLLSVEARNIYEVLLNQGALATSYLRQESGLSGGGAVARRFDSALVELQMQFQIVKVGVSDASRWGYAYVYDLFTRQFPAVADLAHLITTDQAMDTLLLAHLENVAVESTPACQRLFRWDPWEWERAIARLTQRGSIVSGLQVEGIRGPAIAHKGALAALAQFTGKDET